MGLMEGTATRISKTGNLVVEGPGGEEFVAKAEDNGAIVEGEMTPHGTPFDKADLAELIGQRITFEPVNTGNANRFCRPWIVGVAV